MPKKLPKHLQEQLDRLPKWTAKEVQDIYKRLTPEQRNLIDREIAKASVKIRRALFSVIPVDASSGQCDD
jgi:hypothetical protein